MNRGFRGAGLGAVLALLGGMTMAPALALDLGQPTLHSAPGEPLDVTIPVLCAADECEHFDAALGGSADYRAAGLPEPRLRGQLGFGYDHALDAIRVRTTAPLPAQNLHLLFDIHSGATSLRKDVVVVVPAPPQAAAETEPAATAQPAPAATATVAAVPGPPAPVALAGAPPAPRVATPAAAPVPAAKPQDAGAQALGLLKSLDPTQIAMGIGIGAGLLLAYLLFRFASALLRRVGQVFSHGIGGIRYRWAERRRERGREAAAPAAPPSAAPLRSPASSLSGRGGAVQTQALRDVKDELAIRLRKQVDAEPERLDLKLKLAERLFAVQDGEAYTDLVMSLKPLLKDTAWERLRKMGQQLRPYDDRFLNLSDRGETNVVPLMKSNY